MRLHTAVPVAIAFLLCACPEIGDRPCLVGNQLYPSGSGSIPSPDGCNVCSCSDGQLACTLKFCVPDDGESCEVGGVTYPSGSRSIPAEDGCNTCSCDDGALACTEKACLPEEAACIIGGKRYESGASGIKDPFSCNKCFCNDGALGCTKIYCPEPCPTGTVQATSCASCGPVDNCEALETGCLPSCETDADCSAAGSAAQCFDHVCRTLCG